MSWRKLRILLIIATLGMTMNVTSNFLSCYRGSICNFTYIPLSWSNGYSPFQNF
jgi:hypothetical protein